MLVGALMVTGKSELVPVASPLQPVKTKPARGRAVRVISEAASKKAPLEPEAIVADPPVVAVRFT